MITYIDKLAFIYLQNRKVLVTLSHGKDTWYLPGGKREKGETDNQALIREVKEELTVDLDPATLKFYGVFEAQAHGKPKGTIVRMTCYQAEFTGELKPSTEIAQIDFFTHAQKDQCSAVDHLILNNLIANNLID